MFEQCEAFPTPVGGIAVTPLPIGCAHPTPRHPDTMTRYSLLREPPSEKPSGRPKARRAPELQQDDQRSIRGGLSIVGP